MALVKLSKTDAVNHFIAATQGRLVPSRREFEGSDYDCTVNCDPLCVIYEY